MKEIKNTPQHWIEGEGEKGDIFLNQLYAEIYAENWRLII